MHKSFNFPIRCESPQIAINEPKIIDTELGLYICEKNLDVKKSYDAFDTTEIIPSLINLVEKLKKRGDKQQREDKENVDLIVKWVEKWGILQSNKEDPTYKDFYGQRVSGLIQEAYKLHDLWTLYRDVTNRDLENLKEKIKIMKNDDLPWAATHTYFFFENTFYIDSIDYTFNINNPLQSYQRAAMLYLAKNIEVYIDQNRLFSKSIKKSQAYEKNKDFFKITPTLGFRSLLSAIYMQFYILLNENEKKICPICNEPFLARRKNQKYCINKFDDTKPSACKLTAKSRNYRANKKREAQEKTQGD